MFSFYQRIGFGILMLTSSSIVEASTWDEYIANGTLSAQEWQAIQTHILSTDGFLLENQTFDASDKQDVPKRTVLSGTLGLTDYIKPFNTDAGDGFGFYIDLSGDVLVVGAAGEDSNGLGDDGSPSSNNLTDSGAAYVFRRGAGGWQQEAYLKASNPSAGDEFGLAVAVDGDRIVIGARREDSSTTGVNSTPNEAATDAGAAYVFEYDNGVWEEVAYLKASNTGASDLFGHNVDISGDTVAVSAINEDSSTRGVNTGQNNSASNAGAVYVFVENDGEWVEQAFVKASNTDAIDVYGARIAIDGNTLIVGAPQEDSSSTQVNGSQGNQSNRTTFSYGAAYVYQRADGVWAQQAYLKAPNAQVGDHFGESVAVAGDFAVVGARFEDSSAVGVDGELFDNTAIDAGAAYVYRRNSAGTWRFLSYLKANNSGANDLYGSEVSMSGNFIVVGSLAEDSSLINIDGSDDNSLPDAGAAYVYQLVGNDVEFVSALKSSAPDANDVFGIVTSVSGTGIAIGSRDEDSNAVGVNGDPRDNSITNSGAAFLFQTISTFYPISGVVTGLAEGNSVTLQNNGEDVITVDANGDFRFPGLFVEGETYDVLVTEDGLPVNPHQSCSVENGSGTLDEAAVGSILVRCTLRTLSINENINSVNQAIVNVPIQLSPEGLSLSGVEFALDYDTACLNPDVNNDGQLDNISINVSEDFTSSIRFDPAISDGEIHITIVDQSLPITPLNAGDIVNIGFRVDCPESQTTDLFETNIQFSESNRPSFSDLAGNSVEGSLQDGKVRVWAGITGDCDVSGPGELEIADLVRLVFEIADDDGTSFLDAPESDNFGSPQGCDANSNQEINVADLACLTLLLGDRNCENVRLNTTAVPEVNINTRVEGDILWIQAHMQQKGNAASAVSFSLEINPFALHHASVDFNHDGVPDRLLFNQDLVAAPNVVWHEDESRVDVFMANVNAAAQDPVLPLPEGLLLEIGIPRLNAELNAFKVSSTLLPVFADTGGVEVIGEVSVGDVIFQDAFEEQL